MNSSRLHAPVLLQTAAVALQEEPPTDAPAVVPAFHAHVADNTLWSTRS
jgi:hypothetical protein